MFKRSKKAAVELFYKPYPGFIWSDGEKYCTGLVLCPVHFKNYKDVVTKDICEPAIGFGWMRIIKVQTIEDWDDCECTVCRGLLGCRNCRS